jgi:hypothetical protein
MEYVRSGSPGNDAILRVEMETTRRNSMRFITPTLAAVAIVSALATSAQADPYKWCAVYGGFGNTRESCYYMTIGQCQASVSGLGGFCKPSPWYDGKPVRTPEDGPPRRKRRS